MARRLLKLLQCSARYWSEDNVSTTGAALAYYCAFSLAPLLVILLALAGFVIGQSQAYVHLNEQLTALFGPATARILLTAVESSQGTHGVISTILSVVTLLFGATTVLSALQTALDQIWQSGKLVRAGVWGWLRARLLSLGFILALGFLLLISLTISTGLSQLQKEVAEQHTAIVGVVAIFDFLVSMAVTASLFALIFRFMPARRLEWRCALWGALLTAGLFELGRWLIGIYLSYSTQPSAFGAAASFAALLLWLYYTAQIFLFGAEFTACLGGLRSEHPQRRARDHRVCL
jgi:membrane protein